MRTARYRYTEWRDVRSGEVGRPYPQCSPVLTLGIAPQGIQCRAQHLRPGTVSENVYAAGIGVPRQQLEHQR